MRSYENIAKSEKSRRIHKVFRYYYEAPSQDALILYNQYHTKKDEYVLDQLRTLILSETDSLPIHLLLD